MTVRRGAFVFALVAALAGCAAPPTARAPEASSAPATALVIDPYDLYTHCGIREAKIGDDYYVATPPLSDGSGNPPYGWGNPGQSGTMTVYDDGTARFSAGLLGATFTLRVGATDWLGPICS